MLRPYGLAMKIGIDIGRVIIKPAQTADDTSFLHGSDADAMQTLPMPGAFEAIEQIFAACGGRVWLVSKCGERIQARSRAWLAHWGFSERTGVTRDRFRFCRRRPDKAIIARELGLDVFIDDRIDIARHLAGVVPLRYLYGPQKSSATVPAGVTVALNWESVLSDLLPRLEARPTRTTS